MKSTTKLKNLIVGISLIATCLLGTSAYALTPSKLINVSARVLVGTGEDVLINGFSIAGTGVKTLMIRGSGPNLQKFKLAGALVDTTVKVFDNTTGKALKTNSHWAGSQRELELEKQVGAYPFDIGSYDSVVIIDLTAGVYSAILSGTNDTTGIGLLEVYDCGGTGTAKIVNMSCRAKGGTGADTLIVGFVLNGQESKKLLIRGVGQTLSGYGIKGFNPNPSIKLFNGKQVIIGENDDWTSDLTPTMNAVGAGAMMSKDAAMVVTVNPGSYSFHVEAKDSQGGVALGDLFEVQ